MPNDTDVPPALLHQLPRWDVQATPDGVELTLTDPGLVKFALWLQRDEARTMAATLIYMAKGD